MALESTLISHGLPYPAERRGRPRVGGGGPGRRGRAGDRGGPRRAVPRRSRRRRPRGTRDRARRLGPQGRPAEPGCGACRRRVGRHDRERDDDRRPRGGHRCLRDRRDRRRPPRCGGRGRPQLDISADLDELGRTPVAVVCAGPKAILDVPLTLEYLETHGVPVVAIGQADLPGFYSRIERRAGAGLRLGRGRGGRDRPRPPRPGARVRDPALHAGARGGGTPRGRCTGGRRAGHRRRGGGPDRRPGPDAPGSWPGSPNSPPAHPSAPTRPSSSTTPRSPAAIAVGAGGQAPRAGPATGPATARPPRAAGPAGRPRHGAAGPRPRAARPRPRAARPATLSIAGPGADRWSRPSPPGIVRRRERAPRRSTLPGTGRLRDHSADRRPDPAGMEVRHGWHPSSSPSSPLAFVVLGAAAAAFGVDSRPGFDSRFSASPDPGTEAGRLDPRSGQAAGGLPVADRAREWPRTFTT